MKCTKCQSLLTVENKTKDSSRKSGFHPWCRTCINKTALVWRKKHRDKVYAWDKAWRQKNPDRVKQYYRSVDLKRHFGITVQEYDLLLEKQQGRCLICLSIDDKKLAVDHDHKTGRIRGLLCQRCNTTLGRVEDSIELLERMISYLKGVQ